MNVNFSRLVCGAALLLLLGTNTALANLRSVSIERNWTVAIGGERYGLIEYRDGASWHCTEISCGSWRYTTSLTAWQVVGGAAGLVAILLMFTGSLFFLCPRRSLRSTE